MHRALVVLGLVLLAAGCGGSERAAPAKPRSPFAYDAAKPVALRDRGRVNARSYPIAIRDVSYAAPGRRIDAFLIVPPGRRLPAVIFLHGAGDDRREQVLAATYLAARHVVTLTITAPSSTIGPPPNETMAQALARDGRVGIADVVAARRAVDVLRSLPQVDSSRIGVVGWSLGAHTAAILAGVEPRIRAFVLMSGGAVPVSEYVAQTPADLRAAARRTLRMIDPLRWIAQARPGTLLLQDGTKDQVVPHGALVALAKAAPRGSEIRWYRAGHALNAAASHDQTAWLVRKLSIRGPAVAGAKTGP